MYPIFMDPAYKHYLWGGDRLNPVMGKKSPYPKTGESWELSTHKDGQSIARNGELIGKSLTEIVEHWGAACIGSRFANMPTESIGKDFPILIKFIDAKQNLSIQVHPNDEYSLAHENQQGKTEMWYILDAEPGCGLYYGFNRDLTREEFEAKTADGTITDAMNFCPCKVGDVFFIPAGTIHAICEGILVAEIQQNSNITYRVFDYNRVDDNGNKRELHTKKAADVTCLEAIDPRNNSIDENQAVATLAACEYFTVKRANLSGSITLTADADSFHALLITEGSPVIKCGRDSYPCQKGDCVFIPAGMGSYDVEGAGQLLIASV